MSAPSRVESIERYWTEQPPEQSKRCTWWVVRIEQGWRRNHRLKAFGYYESAEFFGVYIWEWLNVLSPLLTKEP